MEINPLVVTKDGDLIALDCKFVMDDSAVPRHAALADTGTPEQTTAIEARAKALGLKFIELDGDVGVLANGAGLTMTTMDAVRHYGGNPANFMEIGGESYTKAKPALELVLANPRVKCLLVNFCGAFARTDVMAQGRGQRLARAQAEDPDLLHHPRHRRGRGHRPRQGAPRHHPFDLMDDAVKAAVAMAKGATP